MDIFQGSQVGHEWKCQGLVLVREFRQEQPGVMGRLGRGRGRGRGRVEHAKDAAESQGHREEVG